MDRFLHELEEIFGGRFVPARPGFPAHWTDGSHVIMFSHMHGCYKVERWNELGPNRLSILTDNPIAAVSDIRRSL